MVDMDFEVNQQKMTLMEFKGILYDSLEYHTMTPYDQQDSHGSERVIAQGLI